MAYSGLEQFIGMPLRNYSSGMLARLAFSIATVVNPEILIVDEILAVGDETFQRKSKQRMMELMRYYGAVRFPQHPPDSGDVPPGPVDGSRACADAWRGRGSV